MYLYNNYREEVMSVGTNENEKIVNKIYDNKVKENVENSANDVVSSVEENKIDMEATQRIDIDATQRFEMQATQRLDFLGELRKDTEKAAQQLLENQQGSIASKSC